LILPLLDLNLCHSLSTIYATNTKVSDVPELIHSWPPSMVMKDTTEGPLKGGNSGSFKHNNTVAPNEDKVFPLFDNRGKTAIVTGAGAGIGLAVAQGFAESGANVAIWYHGNRKALDRAKEIEEEYGVTCEPRGVFIWGRCL